MRRIDQRAVRVVTAVAVEKAHGARVVTAVAVEKAHGAPSEPREDGHSVQALPRTIVRISQQV